jgi:6-phosphogluconate dehydrogenase
VEKQLYEIGMVGLGTMGRSLVLNMADHGFSVAGYDKDLTKGQALLAEGAGKPVASADNVKAFIDLLRPPRVVMLLVAPAKIVDAVLGDLLPVVQQGDLIIDAGNSYFKDTDARGKRCADKGVRFFGMGVSGGEAGARYGPSMMPGGPRDAYERVRPILESVAAKVDGEPCVSYMGAGSAGHYVKMVHNGIEYGLMQLISETYDLLKRGLGLSNDELSAVYKRWNEGELASFLLEITATVFLEKDDKGEGRLIDKIKDAARQKGTGKWTSQDALDLQVSVPALDLAVAQRDLSGLTEARAAVHSALGGPAPHFTGNKSALVDQVGHALCAASVVTYSQGLDLLGHASKAYDYGLNLAEVAKIWRGGCIIRAALLEDIRAAYARGALPSLLADSTIAAKLKPKVRDLRAVVRTVAELGLPAPGMMACLAYFDSLRSGWLPTNLIQAQRDFFGAHTYERTDQPGTFHTHWGSS